MGIIAMIDLTVNCTTLKKMSRKVTRKRCGGKTNMYSHVVDIQLRLLTMM